MIQKPKLSIIVPVYNVEKYLRQCLNSIVRQTLRDIEIVVVNDGSTDGSLKIIKEFAKGDERIKIIDKPNEGVGKTYNHGIDVATAEYIGFVESDDWIEPDMYESLYKIASSRNVEVVKGKFRYFDDENQKYKHSLRFSKYDTNKIINPYRNPEIFYVQASIWTAIYSSNFLRNNDIRFLESPGASYQDTSFNFKVWAAATSVYLLDKVIMYYRIHDNQSVKSKDRVFCVCDEFIEVDRWLNERGVPDFVSQIKNRVKYGAYRWNLDRLDGENKAAFFERMKVEFEPIIKKHQIDVCDMTMKAYWKMRKRFTSSIWSKIMYALVVAIQPFIKDKRKNGRMVYLTLLFIPIWSRKIKVKGM